MSSGELLLAGIARQAELLAAREVSSAELVEASLERIAALDPRLNAFRVVLAERAREEALEADRRIAAGERAPLLGVPIAVKDEVDVAGELTTHGTLGFERPAEADDVHPARLRAAGAVLVGKTNMSELAACGFTETEAWGVTRNPWDPTRTPGGSSGGSAAAVAAGMVGAALASDAGGSIRIPAANCGLFGLKPQRGRISLAPRAAKWHGMSHAGCLTRRVIDTALWLDVAAGPALGDRNAPPPPTGSFVAAAERAPEQLRIAWSSTPVRGVLPTSVDSRVAEAIEATIGVLRTLGHRVEEHGPDFGNVGNVAVPRFLAGVSEAYDDVPHPERLEPRTRGFARMGRMSSGPVLRAALRAEHAHAGRINGLFDRFDLLLTPVTAEPAVEIGRWAGSGALQTLLGMGRVYPFTPVWNYTGQPAASIPAPVGAGELPIGAMLIAAPNREELLLSLAAQVEAEMGWSEGVPAIAR